MKTLPLADLADADEVQVTDNLGIELAVVTDPAAIAGVAAWLAEREDGWFIPADGLYVAGVRLRFTREGRALGSIGLAPYFLVAQRVGAAGQRVAEPGERAEALAILGVEDPGDD